MAMDEIEMSIEEMLGAVFGWTYCRQWHGYEWTMLYWPACRDTGQPAGNHRPRPLRRLSGYRDGRRGRHWDRRR